MFWRAGTFQRTHWSASRICLTLSARRLSACVVNRKHRNVCNTCSRKESRFATNEVFGKRRVTDMREAVIVSVARTPVGKAKRGLFAHTRVEDLGKVAIQAALSRAPGLDPAE